MSEQVTAFDWRPYNSIRYICRCRRKQTFPRSPAGGRRATSDYTLDDGTRKIVTTNTKEVMAKREPYTAGDLIDTVLACAEEELRTRLSGAENGFDSPDVQVLFGRATGMAMHLHQNNG